MKKLLLFAVVMLFACSVFAQNFPIDFSVGVKGFGGGNYINAAGDPKIPGAEVPFEEASGGWAAGGGLSAEVRFPRAFVGLSAEMLFDYSENWVFITYNKLAKLKYSAGFSSLRFPLLVKGIINTGGTRVSLGAGPEFVVGMKPSSDVSVEEGKQYVSDASLNSEKDLFSSFTENDVLFSAVLGFAFKISSFAVTLDMKYSYNLTQPEAYVDERAKINFTKLTRSVLAANTMEGRIMLGVSYDFSLSGE